MMEKQSLKEFIKFNLVSFSVTLLQLLLANLLPYLFDNLSMTLPDFLNKIFYSTSIPSKYIINNKVTLAYVLPFLLSNLLANIYAYFVNMKATFKGSGSKGGFIGYVVILLVLILFSTWLQGVIVSALYNTSLNSLSRTIASLTVGTIQMCILFPLEKFVLFKNK